MKKQYDIREIRINTYSSAIPFRKDYPPSWTKYEAIHLPTGIKVTGYHYGMIFIQLKEKVKRHYTILQTTKYYHDR